MAYSVPIDVACTARWLTEVGRSMPDELSVDPTELTSAGNVIGDHAETLHALHQSAHANATEAHSGWVGSSAGALSGLLESWATTSTRHFQQIGGHSCDMHVAAAQFSLMEQHHTEAFNDISQAAGGADPTAL